MRRFVLGLTATAILVAGSYAVRAPLQTAVVTDDTPSASNDVAAPVPATAMSSGAAYAGPAELDRLIDVFERRSADSADALDFRTLGRHYFNRGYITGNPDDYVSAVAAYSIAYDLAPTDRSGRIGYGRAAVTVHDFTTALAVATEMLDVDGSDADGLAIASDASFELGDFAAGLNYLDRLETAAPGHPAVLARLAGAAHLDGRQDEAIALAATAYETAQNQGFTGRDLAFFPLLHTDLLLDAGRYDEARDTADAALGIDDSYPLSHASLGRVLAHTGDYEAALDAYQHALTLFSDPGWDAASGELLRVLGRSTEAETHFAAAVDALQGTDEIIFGRSLAALYADLDIAHAEALRLAREDLERRRDIHAYDTLAWALYRNGLFAEARTASDQAQATGTMDAGLLYHSVVISAALGDTTRAVDELSRLLEANPGFSPVQSQHAVELLRTLTG